MPHSARPPLRSSAKEEALPPIQPQSSSSINNSYFTNNNNNNSPGAYTQHTQVSPSHTHTQTRREEDSPEHLSRFLAWKHQPEPPTAHPALAQASQGSHASQGSSLSPHSTLTPPPRRPPSARPLSSSSHNSPAQHLPPIDWDAHTHANTHTHAYAHTHNALSQSQSKSDVPTFSPQSASTQRHLLAPLSPALSPEKLSFSPAQAHTQTYSPHTSFFAHNSPTQLAEAKGLYLDTEQCKTQPHTSQHAHTTPNTNAHHLRTPANTPVENLTAGEALPLDAHTLTLSPLSLSQPKAPTQPHTHTNPHIHPRTHTPHSGEKPQSAHSQRVLLPLSNREVERDSPLTPSSPLSPSPHNSERLAQLHTRPHAHSRSQSHNERTHLPEVGLSLSPEQRVPLSVSFSAETLVQSPTQSHAHTAHPPVHSRNTHSSALHRSHKEED